MPHKISGDITFELQHQHARGLAGGGPQVVELGPSLWNGAWRIVTVTTADFNEWAAWLTSLRGGLRLFKGRPRRQWPTAYPKGFAGLVVGGQPFSGSGSLAVIDAGRASATVGGLPPGFTLAVGDHFSLPVGDRQHLHKITEGGAAAANGFAAISFEPPLHQSAAIGAAVLFDSPWCDMVLGQGASTISSPSGGTVTFTGTQRII